MQLLYTPHGTIAQAVEREVEGLGVGGASPSGSTRAVGVTDA